MVEKHPIDLSLLAETFDINNRGDCQHLEKWLASSYVFNDFEQTLFDQVYEKTRNDVNYFNEEELKIQLIAFLFFLADIDIEGKIKVFYERPLTAILQEKHKISVVVDCMVATPMRFNKPKLPYFFLQEFKKGEGDDKDPEAQMLAAMLVAQHKNDDGRPVYGSFLIGSNWWFTTLIGQEYCLSREYNASNRADLEQIVFVLRRLKEMILEN
jgi:hypothetical protein